MWIFNALTQRLQKAEDKIEAMNNELPKEYVQKGDYKDDMREIKDLLRQIFDKLDGKADKVTNFISDLNCPTGFQFYKDGVLLMQAPDLWFIRDTDGDGRFDTLEVETRNFKGPRTFEASGLPMHLDNQTIVRERSPCVEYYSIDEFFLSVDDPHPEVFARNIQAEILQRVGVPVTIGIARSPADDHRRARAMARSSGRVVR